MPNVFSKVMPKVIPKTDAKSHAESDAKSDGKSDSGSDAKTDTNSDDPDALENYLPQGFGNLFVLNAYMGIKNETIRHQLINSPYRLAPIGKKIGKAASELAAKTEVPKDIDYLAYLHLF